MNLTITIDKNQLREKLGIRDGVDGLQGAPGLSPVIDHEAIVQQAVEEVKKHATEYLEKMPKLGGGGSSLMVLDDAGVIAHQAGKIKFSGGVSVAHIGSGPVVTVKEITLVDISDSLNGVLKTFTLPANSGIKNVQSSSAPFAFRKTVDYTENGTSITFTSEIDAATTLAEGQTVIISILPT